MCVFFLIGLFHVYIRYVLFCTGGKKKTGPKAHKLAEQFPKGLVLRDLFKKEWVLGDVVGKGGFGLIYLGLY